MATNPDRWTAGPGRFGIDVLWLEAVDLSRERDRARLGPSGAEDADRFVERRAPPLEGLGPEGHKLLAQPAGADAEDRPPTGQRIQGGPLLGRQQRRSLRRYQDAHPELDAARPPGQERERGDCLEAVADGGRGEGAWPPVGVGRLHPLRDDDVVGDPDRVEPQFLGPRAEHPDRFARGPRAHVLHVYPELHPTPRSARGARRPPPRPLTSRAVAQLLARVLQP